MVQSLTPHPQQPAWLLALGRFEGYHLTPPGHLH